MDENVKPILKLNAEPKYDASDSFDSKKYKN